MKHLTKITGALLLGLISTAHAQSMNSSSTSGVNNPATPTYDANTSSSTQPSTMTSAPSTTHDNKAKNGLVSFTPDTLQWKDAPTLLPPGAQIAVLEGNPKSKGNVIMRFKFPANYQVQPLYCSSPIKATVLSGTWNLGLGDKFDNNAGTAYSAGSFVVLPARKHHFVWTTEETIIQVNAVGPVIFKYVNPSDDPSKKATSSDSAIKTNAQDQSSTNQPNLNNTPSQNR